MQAQDEHDAIEEAARQYAEELTDWRKRRELSKRGLATLMNYDRSYVSQIEGCHLPPTEHFTRRAEAVLDAGGALWARWEAYEAARIGSTQALSRSAARLEPVVGDRHLDLKVSPFVAWVADHSSLSFREAYAAVVEGVEQFAAR